MRRTSARGTALVKRREIESYRLRVRQRDREEEREKANEKRQRGVTSLKS